MPSLPTATVPEGYTLRIQPTAFTVSVAVCLGVGLVCAAVRLGCRLRTSRTFFADDYLLLFALCALCVAAGLAYTVKDAIYLQMYVGIGWEPQPPDFTAQLAAFQQRIQPAGSLVWAAIYAIKFSFVLFFRKLVRRVPKLQRLWWAVAILTVACGITAIPLGLVICSHFTPDYLDYCPLSTLLYREQVYLFTMAAMDILTDLLIISIPVALVYPIKLPLQRKLAILGMLCLNSFMIAITVVRVTGASLPTEFQTLDAAWVLFWQAMEAVVAVIMVSMLALRSMFGLHNQKTVDRRSPDPENTLTSRSSRSLPGPRRLFCCGARRGKMGVLLSGRTANEVTEVDRGCQSSLLADTDLKHTPSVTVMALPIAVAIAELPGPEKCQLRGDLNKPLPQTPRLTPRFHPGRDYRL